METRFDIHEEVLCVYCGDIYKGDILSVKKDSDSETYEVQIVQDINPFSRASPTKIIEYEEDEIFSTIDELQKAIRKECEERISKMYNRFEKRYNINNQDAII
jgi:hypothetical protein